MTDETKKIAEKVIVELAKNFPARRPNVRPFTGGLLPSYSYQRERVLESRISKLELEIEILKQKLLTKG